MKLFRLLGVSAFFISSCEIINPSEEIPSYIRIEKIDVTTNKPLEGSNSASITDAWVYVNDQIIGGFELPATIPVLASGDVNLKVKAGIKNSGAVALRRDYPFYAQYENTSFKLVPGTKSEANPTVTYYSNLSFSFIEEFEGSAFKFLPNSASVGLSATSNPDEAFEGTSGKVNLLNETDIFYSTTINNYVLPKGGANVYLEMDYKTTGNIEVRIIANYSGSEKESSIIILYADTKWKKIYIDLGPSISSEVNAQSFKIVLMAYNMTDQTSSVSYFDNVKLINAGS